MKITIIREEDWGIGIRYETKKGFIEFVFDKETILNAMNVSDISQLKLKKKDFEEGELERLIQEKVYKGIAEGELKKRSEVETNITDNFVN